MANTRVMISVRGFTETEARAGLADLMGEFQHRPWILHPSAAWDADRKCLVVSVEYEGADIEACRSAARDEISDCVIACFGGSGEISFEIEDAGGKRPVT